MYVCVCVCSSAKRWPSSSLLQELLPFVYYPFVIGIAITLSVFFILFKNLQRNNAVRCEANPSCCPHYWHIHHVP